MAGSVYTSGQLVNLSTTFTITGDVVDPTTVRFKLRNPTGGITSYVYGTDAALVRDSTGIYHVNYTAVSAGIHFYRFEGWTACQAAAEDNFQCASSMF